MRCGSVDIAYCCIFGKTSNGMLFIAAKEAWLLSVCHDITTSMTG